MSRILDALESSDRANTIIGRAMGRVPHDKSNNLDIIIAIAAVLASVTATMAAIANLMVVVLGGQ